MIVGELKRRMTEYRNSCKNVYSEFNGNDQMISRGLKKIVDTRIHLVLFFFDGHHPKDQDFVSTKIIQEFTNVIPILAKGDSYTMQELRVVKRTIVERANELDVEFFNIRSTLEDIEDK